MADWCHRDGLEVAGSWKKRCRLPGCLTGALGRCCRCWQPVHLGLGVRDSSQEQRNWERVCSCLRGVAIEWAISADTPAPYPLATRLAVSCSSHKNHQALPQQSPRTSQLHDLRVTKCLRDENNPLLLKMEKLPLRQIGFKSPQVSTLPVISLSPPPVPQSDKRGGGRIMSS